MLGKLKQIWIRNHYNNNNVFISVKEDDLYAEAGDMYYECTYVWLYSYIPVAIICKDRLYLQYIILKSN